MAKYKQPKNEKHKARKDLKDYTHDKDVESMVPNASGEIMPDVPRKDDKEIIDDVENMVPKIKMLIEYMLQNKWKMEIQKGLLIL